MAPVMGDYIAGDARCKDDPTSAMPMGGVPLTLPARGVGRYDGNGVIAVDAFAPLPCVRCSRHRQKTTA